MLESGAKALKKIERNQAETGEIIKLLRIVGYLAPDQSTASNLKEKLASLLSRTMGEASAENVFTLNNVSFEAFRQGESRIGDIVSDWVINQIKYSGLDDIVKIVAQLGVSSAEEWWRKAIKKGFHDGMQQQSPAFLEAVWRCWNARPETLLCLTDIIPKSLEMEMRLVDNCPAVLPLELEEELSQFTRNRGWSRLHGAVVAASHTPKEAIARQYCFPGGPGDGLRTLVERIPSEELIAETLREPRHELIALAGVSVKERPELLRDFDPTVIEWRKIWLAAIEEGCDVWAGIANPGPALHEILDEFLSNEDVGEELLIKISEADQGYLYEYPRRAELWSKLPRQANTNFLRSTAHIWIGAFSSGVVSSRAEAPLDEAVQKEAETAFANSALDGDALLLYLDLYPEVSERTVIRWLRATLGVFGLLERCAERLGEICKSRHWTRVAREIIHQCKIGRKDLEPAAPACRSLMSWLETIWPFDRISSPSENNQTGIHPISPPGVDVAVLTALPKELDAFLKHEPGWIKQEASRISIRTYYQCPGEHGLSIISACTIGMGHVNAALLTRDVITEWKPRIIILTGIAATLSEEVELGDIVVSKQIVDYELGKVSPEGESPRPLVYRADARLVETLMHFMGNQSWVSRISVARPDDKAGIDPKAHQGDVLSGNKVVADEEMKQRLLSLWPRALAVEMESAGIAAALYQIPSPPAFVMIKSICDRADSKKDDRWQDYAADSAAAFTSSFLRAGELAQLVSYAEQPA